MSAEYLFVYGLLRRKANHEMSDFLFENAEFVSEASYQGRLYLVSHYPGVIPSADPSDRVVGDVYKIEKDLIFRELDQFEGVGEEFSSPNEYRRVKQQIGIAGSKEIDCWIYLYNHPTSGCKRIFNGDFLAL